MPRNNQPYQLTVKNLYLTYPQVQRHYGLFFDKDLCLEEFKLFLENCQTNRCKPVEVSLCVEEYPTDPEHWHVHALLTFPKVLTHNLNTFNFTETTTCHRTELSSTSRANLKKIVEYFKKDGCFNIGHHWSTREEKVNMDWGSVINAPNRTVAEDILRKEQPKLYIQSYSNVQSFLSGCFEGSNDVYEQPTGIGAFTIPVNLSEWMEEELVKVRYLIRKYKQPFPLPNPILTCSSTRWSR